MPNFYFTFLNEIFTRLIFNLFNTIIDCINHKMFLTCQKVYKKYIKYRKTKNKTDVINMFQLLSKQQLECVYDIAVYDITV